MWKRFSIIARTMESMMFLLKYDSIENKFLQWPF